MNLFDLFRGKTTRRTAEHLPKSASSEPALQNQPFVAGGNYFGVTLAGLHLTDARHFATEVLPLCVCLCEYQHGSKSVGVPFSIGPEELRARLKQAGAAEKAKPAWVELQDLPVIQAKPVRSEHLSIFSGLFSVPGNDFVESLLNVVGSLGRSISSLGTALDPGLDVVKTVYGGFNSLLGLQNVTQVVAALNGTMLKQSGYYLVSSAPAGSLDTSALEVRNGQLYRWKNPVTDINYCVLALPCYASVLDAAKMAPQLFDDEWTAVNKAFEASEATSAIKKLRGLQAAISTSPDLIQSDRTTLMATYAALYNEQVRAFGLPEAALATRGGGGAGLEETISRHALRLRDKRQEPAAATLDAIVAAFDDKTLIPPAPKSGDQGTVLSVAKALHTRLGPGSEDDSVAEVLLSSTF